ncbi:hydrolase [Bdellovibrio sp. 22V]|uniref:hydrolase n=1 Tax=Bdellovibrio sp. 22V TaxID=3044166 RepID=UPI002543F31A|nr:hydrolase [Bdellovibrio sp. 22V]WII73750.1 hydrolase [Bdellovibrio sp. 22V]
MKVFILLLITLSASFIGQDVVRGYVVVWNVGQGQWVTKISATQCQHFDMGGEFFPWKKILQACRGKTNSAVFSHWDWDHIGAVSKPSVRFLNLCAKLRPLGGSSKRKMKLLKTLPDCADIPNKLRVWSPLRSKNSNSQSQVVYTEGLLIPGDSPIAQEHLWKDRPWLSFAKVLILGHHGSNTSTSEPLLQRLPRLRLTISSARWARYKHPHPEVLRRLKSHNLPLLRTEDWGNIWLEQ